MYSIPIFFFSILGYKYLEISISFMKQSGFLKNIFFLNDIYHATQFFLAFLKE